MNRIFLKNIFRFLIFTRALKEEIAYTEEEINSRTLVILREAEKKKVPCKSITFFNNPTNFFSMIIHGKKEFFEGLPGIGVEVIVLAFAVVVIGGMGSIPGALIGSILVGVVRAAAVHEFPQAEMFVIYAIMAIVLVFRPEGLFAPPAVRKI